MPIDLQSLLVFIPIALALNLTPGSDMAFCLSEGIRSGPRAGIAASMGIATGSFIHAAVAGLGLAALIDSYPLSFEVIRWSGVIYLLWLAIFALRNPIASETPSVNLSDRGILSAWRNGIVVCLLNPKVALFILALVPQFVDPLKGSVLVQFLIYGAILNIGGTVINGMVGVLAGSAGQYLAKNRCVSLSLQYITSLVYVGLAARLAFDRR